MTPSQNSPQPSQNEEKSVVGYTNESSQEVIVLTASTQSSVESSQEGEPSPNALVQAGLYDEESQESFTQESADVSQNSNAASQPAKTSQPLPQAPEHCRVCGGVVGSISETVGSQPKSEPATPKAENQTDLPQKAASQ